MNEARGESVLCPICGSPLNAIEAYCQIQAQSQRVILCSAACARTFLRGLADDEEESPPPDANRVAGSD